MQVSVLNNNKHCHYVRALNGFRGGEHREIRGKKREEEEALIKV